VAAEDVLAAEMPARAESTNLSFFAFTATPNAKTLELFGHEGISGTAPDEHLPEGADHRRALPRERGLAHLQPVCASKQHHDFFSGSGSSYAIGKAVNTEDDDRDF
jgi:hypothetical protein